MSNCALRYRLPMLRKQSRPRSILSEPYVADVLLYLHGASRASATDLLQIMSNYNTITTVVQRLSAIGLVNVVIENRPRVTFRITLTPKGKKVAEKLREAKELIGE